MSEILADELSNYWRHVGSIQLIAGTDLADHNIELDEFLDFLGGRLGDRFVTDREDLARQVAALDLRPDPDGLFRVNEFFCYDDTWRDTVVALARESDAVLMDFRGFGERSRGCLFELEQLVQLIPASKLVILIDAWVDVKLLSETISKGWRTTGADSPNYTARGPVLRILMIRKHNYRMVKRLLLMLFEAAQPAARYEDNSVVGRV